MTIVAVPYQKLSGHLARNPLEWAIGAWLVLDIPTLLWLTQLVPLRTIWHARLSVGPQFTAEHLLLSCWYLSAVGALVLVYRPLLGWLARAPRPRRIAIMAVLSVLACASFPFVSHDLFVYYAEYRMMAMHHANPMITAVASLPHWHRDAWLMLGGWVKSANPYGPLWFLLVRVVGGTLPGFVGFFLVMKALALAATVTTAAAASRIKPGAAPQVLLHPLVAIEFLANGHNDAVMTALLLLGYLLWRTRRWTLAGGAAGLSVATKYISVVAAIILLASVPGWRHRLWSLTGGVFMGALCLLPFWRGWATLKAPLQANHLFLRSPAFVIQGTLVHVLRLTRADARHWAALLAVGAFVVLYGLTMGAFLRRRDPLYIADALLAAGLVLMTWLQFWYVTWALPFYILSSQPRAQRMVSYLAYLEVVRVIGWPDGLPATIQVLQAAAVWSGLVWVWWPRLVPRIPTLNGASRRWRRS